MLGSERLTGAALDRLTHRCHILETKGESIDSGTPAGGNDGPPARRDPQITGATGYPGVDSTQPQHAFFGHRALHFSTGVHGVRATCTILLERTVAINGSRPTGQPSLRDDARESICIAWFRASHPDGAAVHSTPGNPTGQQGHTPWRPARCLARLRGRLTRAMTDSHRAALLTRLASGASTRHQPFAAPRSRLAIRPLAAKRRASLSQSRAELTRPDRGERKKRWASLVGSENAQNGPDQWLAATELSTPPGFIASPLHLSCSRRIWNLRGDGLAYPFPPEDCRPITQQRKRLSGPEKVAIVKRYLIDRVAISDLCDQYGLQPSQVYRWQANLFEHGATSRGSPAGVPRRPRRPRTQDRPAGGGRGPERRQARPEERGHLGTHGGERPGKKSQWGTLKGRWVPHDTRDEIVDYIGHWTQRAELPAKRLLAWLGLARASSTTGSSATARPTSTTARFLATGGWRTGRSRPSSTITTAASARGLSAADVHDARRRRRGGQPVQRLPRAERRRAGSTATNGLASKKGTGFVQPLKPTNTGTSTSATSTSAARFTTSARVLDGYSRYIVHWEIRETMTEQDSGDDRATGSREVPRRDAADHQRQRTAVHRQGLQGVHPPLRHDARADPPYYPQSNGKLERWHGTLKNGSASDRPRDLDDARRALPSTSAITTRCGSTARSAI